MERKHPVIRRDETIRSVLIGVVVLALAMVLLLTNRALIIGDRSWVVPGADIPEGAGPKNFTQSLDTYGVHIIKLSHRPLFAPKTPISAPTDDDYKLPTKISFGYSIVETNILGMPFVPRKDFGHVIYMETPGEFIVAPITSNYLKQMHFPVARPLNWIAFPWWYHLWGWLFVVAGVGAVLFERGALRRRREILDLI